MDTPVSQYGNDCDWAHSDICEKPHLHAQCAACGRVAPPGGLQFNHDGTLLVCRQVSTCALLCDCVECFANWPATTVAHEVGIANLVGTLVSSEGDWS